MILPNFSINDNVIYKGTIALILSVYSNNDINEILYLIKLDDNVTMYVHEHELQINSNPIIEDKLTNNIYPSFSYTEIDDIYGCLIATIDKNILFVYQDRDEGILCDDLTNKFNIIMKK